MLHLILHLIMLIEASEHTLEGKIDAEFNRIRLLKYKSGANCVKNNEKAYMIGFLYGNYYAPYRARTCDPWIKSPLLYQLS